MKNIIIILLTLNLVSCSSYSKFEEYNETSSGFSFEEDDYEDEAENEDSPFSKLSKFRDDDEY